MIIVHTESISIASHLRTGSVTSHSASLMMLSDDRKYCLCLFALFIDAVLLGIIWDCERSEINWCVSFRLVGFCITLVK